MPARMAMPHITPPKEVNAPIDRSMPPLAIKKVMGTATTNEKRRRAQQVDDVAAAEKSRVDNRDHRHKAQ